MAAAAASAPPIVVTGSRNGVVETRHRGHAVVTDRTGAIVWSLGDPTSISYPRSALKPFQVLPLLLSGAAEAYGFTDAEISLMCGSHSGEVRHVDAVRGILAKAGLEEGELQCGAHWPLGQAAGEAVLRSGGAISALHNNCSGKHAGFLAFCKHQGLDRVAYLHHSHPLQAAIRAELCHFAGLREEELHAGTDGCSAPAYALPLAAMARAFCALGQPQACARREAARARVQRAVTSHPFFVAGTGRFCTHLMTVLQEQGVLGKLGAEGFYALSLPHRSLGLAVKVECGSTGPQYALVCAILAALGVLDGAAAAALGDFASAPVRTAAGVRIGSREAVLEPEMLEGLAALSPP